MANNKKVVCAFLGLRMGNNDGPVWEVVFKVIQVNKRIRLYTDLNLVGKRGCIVLGDFTLDGVVVFYFRRLFVLFGFTGCFYLVRRREMPKILPPTTSTFL